MRVQEDGEWRNPRIQQNYGPNENLYFEFW